MMIRLKEKILLLYTKRLVKKSHVVRTSVGFQQAKSMGILGGVDHPDKQESILCFADELKNMGKKVSILGYTTTPVQATYNNFPTISHRDLQIRGTITHPQAKKFINTPFDYLYQVDLKSYPAMDYLLAKSHAKCRVGYYDTARINLFEIMVTFSQETGRNEINDLITQMIHFTQLLKVQ